MTRKRAIVLGVIVLFLALWGSGRLDYTLYPLGLNWNECGRTGLGATFCGSDLTAYQQRLQGIQQQINQTQQSITRSECQADPSLCGP